MQRITLDLEFVTPCFLGGADNHETAEWRAASIRGQLRWWLRAVAGPTVDYDSSRLRSIEEATWGSQSLRSPIGVRCPPLPEGAVETGSVSFETTAEGKGKATINGPAYLGYGPVERVATGKSYVNSATGRTVQEKQFRNTRHFIRPGPATRTTFQLVLQRKGLAPLERLAISAWAVFGGLGARSRRGYGSLVLSQDEQPIHLERAVDELKTVLGLEIGSKTSGGLDRTGVLPGFSSFSPASRILKWQSPTPTWQAALHEAGRAMILFRRRYDSCGADYEWAYGRTFAEAPHRAGFGLPLPFGKVVVEPEHHDRRASPLLIHVHKDGDGYWPVFLYLPADLLPRGEGIRFGGEDGNGSKRDLTSAQFDVVDRFLDRLVTEKLANEVR